MINLNEFFSYWNQIKLANDSNLLKLFQKAAIRYSGLRIDWYFSDNEEKIGIDGERTIAHNAFIDACNIISRFMGKAGIDNNWRKDLGNDRKRIGDFACAIHYFLGLQAR